MSTEIETLRLNTTAFIAANPSVVTLIPRTAVIRGTGATWNEGQARAPQVGRLIDTQTVGGISTGKVQTQDGTQEKLAFQLLLPYDGVVAANDAFSLDNHRHEVTEVLPLNGYELRASVVRYG